MKKHWIIILLWVLVLAVAAMIFFFSSQDAGASSAASGGLTERIMRLFHPGYDQLPARERKALYEAFSTGVRKAAHLLEFSLLGFFLQLLFLAKGVRPALPWVWAAGTLYACTDELHQKWSGGRAPMWLDVGIDSAGVLIGAALAWLLTGLAKRRGQPKDAAD